jgi:cyclohexanecarboxylate-CoA ligase
LTYSQLDAEVDHVAAMLAGLGIGQGDVVSVQLPNWLEASLTFFATIRLGAISNPIPANYRGHELEFIVRQARSRVVVIPDLFRRFDYQGMIEGLRERIPDLQHVLVVGDPRHGCLSFEQELASAPSTATVPTRAADDLALLLYTSGTEANPKGVLHSHNSLLYECQSIIDLYELTSADAVFMPSPLTHITGLLYGVILPTMLETKVVLQDIWNAEVALELIEHERLSFCVGATPFLHGLVNSPARGRHNVSSFRVFGCGGADVPPLLIRAAHEQLGIVASRLYGSSECPTVTGTQIHAPIECHADTDGRAIGSAELRIVDDAGNPLPPGVCGDLMVRGPELFLGYLDPSLNDREFTSDGWFRTGDRAAADEAGYIRIAGRAKDIIVRGGENLSAKEIEDILYENPDVVEVAVVGDPDPRLQERLCVFVVARTTLTLDDLVTFMRSRQVANQKLPERLVLVDELPKTASGKIQKFRLRDQLAREHAQ